MHRKFRRWLGLLLVTAVASAGWIVATPQPASAATSDTVYYWNGVLLDVFRRQGGGPGPLARGAAMMHAAIFDVLNTAYWVRLDFIGSGFRPALGWGYSEDKNVNDDLAAGLAARNVLIDAFPAQRTYIEQRYSQRHGTAAQASATTLANSVVSLVRGNRANDGANATVTYTPSTVPGAWRPTGGPCTSAVDPHWGRVRPFALSSPSEARRPFPGGYSTYTSLLASSLYATQLNEVKSLGRNTSTTRSAEQTRIAHFWANDLDGTYKPPGQLLDHTRVVAQARLSTAYLAVSRLFTRVSFALADATITAWNHKYETAIDLWRPITGIQRAGEDGNSSTTADTTWQPLGSTPCFPAWTSGHATLGGAWAGVMNVVIGSNISFTGGTNDPNAVGVTRTFANFNQAATENGRSRIYLGVHFQFDADDGLASGGTVATKANTKMAHFTCFQGCAPY